MKGKYTLVGLLAICLVSALAMSGLAAGSASAVSCRKVDGGLGKFQKQNPATGVCEGEGIPPEEYIKIPFQGGDPVPGTRNLYCVKVELGEPSSYTTLEKCEKNEAGGGTSGWVRISTACAAAFRVAGQGSSLQKFSQQSLWIPESNCGASYTSSGSLKGREVFGAEKSGIHPGEADAPNTSGDTFIGTDEPLTPKQMENVDEAAGAKEESSKFKGQALVIPVEQAAVAVIVNPPANCKIETISNKNLQEVWAGSITEWHGIAGVTEEKEGCKKPITRVRRKDGSGTTFVFKIYLNEISSGKVDGTCEKTWKEYAKPENNLKWPISSKEGCPAGLNTIVEAKNEGGGGEVEEVGATEGSIGYANLADARAKYKKLHEEEKKPYGWLKVENQGLTGNKAEFPGTAGAEPGSVAGSSNCKETHYGPNKPTTAGPDDNWSEVSGAHTGTTTEKNKHYPICTLTYDVALVFYGQKEEGGKKIGANYPEPKGEAQATNEYLEFVASPTGGQVNLETNDYRKVEEAVGTFAVEEARLVGGTKVTPEKSELTFTNGKKETKKLKYTNSASAQEEWWAPHLPVIGGANPASYAVAGNTCTLGIAIGNSCEIEVEYKGTTQEATLELHQAPTVTLK